MRGVVKAEQQGGGSVPNMIFKGKPIDFSKCIKKDEMDKYYIGNTPNIHGNCNCQLN